MSFLGETRGSLKLFFIFVGIINIASMNLISIIIGLIYLYFGIMLNKLLPSKQKLIINTLIVALILNIVIGTLKLTTQGLVLVGIGPILISVLFTIYLITSIKNISTNQTSLAGNEGQIVPTENAKNDHTIRNILILIIALAVIGYIFITFINKL